MISVITDFRFILARKTWTAFNWVLPWSMKWTWNNPNGFLSPCLCFEQSCAQEWLFLVQGLSCPCWCSAQKGFVSLHQKNQGEEVFVCGEMVIVYNTKRKKSCSFLWDWFWGGWSWLQLILLCFYKSDCFFPFPVCSWFFGRIQFLLFN